MAIFISLAAGAINVNSINRGSAISVGEIAQNGWSQDGKNNFGNGQLFGWSVQTSVLTTLLDQDVIDSPITQNQPTSTLQNQTG